MVDPAGAIGQVALGTMDVGNRAFEVGVLLGKGAFGQVWEAQERGVAGAPAAAVKSTEVQDQAGLNAALLECDVLRQLTQALHPASDTARHVPRYLAHCVMASEVRLAMTRAEGQPLDRWLYGAGIHDMKHLAAAEIVEGLPGRSRVGSLGLAEACDVVGALLSQLSSVFVALQSLAYHRDISAHNIHVSEAADGGLEFVLIDFGMAMHVGSWHREWQTCSLGGDPLYWSPAGWTVFAHGPQYLDKYPHFRWLYKERADHFSLAVMLLEVFFGLWAGPTRDTCPNVGLVAVAHSHWRAYFLRVLQLYQQFHSGNGHGFMRLRESLAVSQDLALLTAEWKTLCSALRTAASNIRDSPCSNILLAVAGLLDSQTPLAWEQIQELLPGRRSPPVSSFVARDPLHPPSLRRREASPRPSTCLGRALSPALTHRSPILRREVSPGPSIRRRF